MLAYLKLSLKENVLFSDKIVRVYHTGHESMMNQKKSNQNINNAILGYSILLSDYGSKIKKINRKDYGFYCYVLGHFYLISYPSRTALYQGISYTYRGFITSPFNLRLIRNFKDLVVLFFKFLKK
jgi:hypothetical protein